MVFADGNFGDDVREISLMKQWRDKEKASWRLRRFFLCLKERMRGK